MGVRDLRQARYETQTDRVGSKDWQMCDADNRRVVAVDSCAAGATSVHCAADRKGIQAPKDISLAQGRQKKRKAGSRNDWDTDTAKKKIEHRSVDLLNRHRLWDGCPGSGFPGRHCRTLPRQNIQGNNPIGKEHIRTHLTMA